MSETTPKPRARKSAPRKATVDAPVATETPAPEAPRRSALALTLKRTMSQGDAGPQVRQAQEALAKVGFFQSAADGHYGTRMARAVRQFQSANGIRVTGEVNAATWEVLMK